MLLRDLLPPNEHNPGVDPLRTFREKTSIMKDQLGYIGFIIDHIAKKKKETQRTPLLAPIRPSKLDSPIDDPEYA